MKYHQNIGSVLMLACDGFYISCIYSVKYSLISVTLPILSRVHWSHLEMFNKYVECCKSRLTPGNVPCIGKGVCVYIFMKTPTGNVL